MQIKFCQNQISDVLLKSKVSERKNSIDVVDKLHNIRLDYRKTPFRPTNFRENLIKKSTLPAVFNNLFLMDLYFELFVLKSYLNYYQTC